MYNISRIRSKCKPMIARKRHTHRLSSKKIVALHTTNTYGSSSYIYYVVLVWYSIDARRAFTFFVYILQCFFCTLTCTHSKCTHDNINRGPVHTIFLSTGPMIWICCVCVAKKKRLPIFLFTFSVYSCAIILFKVNCSLCTHILYTAEQ